MKMEKKLGAGLLALAMPLMMFAITTPGANAATVSSSVDAIDVCEWQMGGAPTEISLVTATVYEGAALSVSDTVDELTIGLSGSQSATALDGTSTDCSFYNNRVAAGVNFTLITTETFDATYGASIEDTAMDFTLTEGGGLSLEADVSACADYTATDRSFTSVNDVYSAFELGSGFIDNKYVGSASGSERCNPSIEIGIEIPESTDVPAGAGQNYSFSGPELVIALATTDVD